MNPIIFSPMAVEARYTPQLLPKFQGNPLIEALPPSLSDEQLVELLACKPDFCPEQRNWGDSERIQMVGSLSNIRIPLERDVAVANALNSMLRNGYVGRAPFTKADGERIRAIYEGGCHSVGVTGAYLDDPAQLSAMLMGLPGMGKTALVTRWFSHLPPVIYHPEFMRYQVPWLHVEMPSDGSSVKGLAYGILSQLDRLIPGADYYQQFAVKGRPGADALMRSVARLMHVHSVGFLVADEVQNLANARKNKQVVMTELVSACNELGVPILFIGTYKAAQVFSLDFRQSRRTCGHGIPLWTPLDRASGEWDEFLDVLWSYQWVRSYVEYSEEISELMFDLSQGIIDVAIKLFAGAQARAIRSGDETLTPSLLERVYMEQMYMLHPMLRALQRGSVEDVMRYEDIAGPSVAQVLAASQQSAAWKRKHQSDPGNAGI
ncbi:TniB family NTP-binding protein [Chitiniphilus purpureus]|uniref:TniB family NTP-binding protein n=1 Tax=Chitiniphilus purpureus TaxID=2981137 RepID=A0ABY6DQK7_9NEIS|nr:TniB family NTP-binding protein [Chitiniphilus sp. CD1]UXY16640.1 TniB family NTP-binding protein [Chitiniphilus sp. CD1]